MPTLKQRFPVIAGQIEGPKGFYAQQTDDNILEIYFYGVLGNHFTSSSFAEKTQSLSEDVEQVNIYINSPGGLVDEGYAMLSVMGRLKKKVDVHTFVDGKAYSMASAIAVNGDKVFMSSTSKLMIHNPFLHLDILGSHTIEDIDELQDWLEERKEQLDKDTQILSGVYASRIPTMGPNAVRDEYLSGGNHFFTPDEAKTLGLIDQIIESVDTESQPAAADFNDEEKNSNVRISSIDGKPRVAAFGNERDSGTLGRPKDDDNDSIAGETLAALLNDAIESEVDFSDDLERSDIIDAMAEAADLSAEAVNSILTEETNCPQLSTFEGFTEVVDLSVEQMIQAAQQDGCNYENEGDQARLVSCGGWFPTSEYDDSEFAKRVKSNYNNGKQSTKTSNAMPDIIKTLNKATESEDQRLPEDASEERIAERVQNIVSERNRFKAELEDIREETRENRATVVVNEVVDEVESNEKGKEVNKEIQDEKLFDLALKVVDSDDDEYQEIIKESMKDKARLNLVPIGKDKNLSGQSTRSDEAEEGSEGLDEETLKAEKEKGEQMRKERKKQLNN